MNFKLVKGIGDYSKGEACIVSAAVAEWRLQNGKPLGEATDILTCVDTTLRHALIVLNDCDLWSSDEHRTTILTPYIKKILGTHDPNKEDKRRLMVVDWCIRNITANILKDIGYVEQGYTLKTLPEIVDCAGMGVAMRTVANMVGDFVADSAAKCVVNSILTYRFTYVAKIVGTPLEEWLRLVDLLIGA